MIHHSYINASDDLPQYEADQIGRQEVTADFYLDRMADKPIWAWVSNQSHEMGLDPWRLNPEIDQAVARGWRLFVQKSDLPEGV